MTKRTVLNIHYLIYALTYLFKILFRGEAIPRVKYTHEEIATWTTIYTSLRKLYDTYASSEFKKNFKELEQYCEYR